MGRQLGHYVGKPSFRGVFFFGAFLLLFPLAEYYIVLFVVGYLYVVAGFLVFSFLNRLDNVVAC